MAEMVETFGQQGLVAPFPGPKDAPDFPEVIYVETVPPGRHEQAQTIRLAALHRKTAYPHGAAAAGEANFDPADNAFREQVIRLRSRKGDPAKR